MNRDGAKEQEKNTERYTHAQHHRPHTQDGLVYSSQLSISTKKDPWPQETKGLETIVQQQDVVDEEQYDENELSSK